MIRLSKSGGQLLPLLAIVLGAGLPVALVSHGAALAQEATRVVVVKAWKRGVDPHRVMAYDADGNEIGVRNLAGVQIDGRHAWTTDYDKVNVAPGVWVAIEQLELIGCPAGIAVSNARPEPAGGYGSGHGC